MLTRNRVYRSTALARCALFFIVTSIQYWSTEYFVISFQRKLVQVHTIFVCIAGSAPIIGIVAGGAISDRLGGYASSEGAERTALLSTVWAVVAAISGACAAAVRPGPEMWRFMAVASCIWVQLLFGAALLPPTTGLLLRSVDKNNIVFAQSFAVLLYTLLGYGLGSYLPGQIAALSHEDMSVALYHAMQGTYCWAFLGLVGIADAYVAIRSSRLSALRVAALAAAASRAPSASSMHVLPMRAPS